MPDDDEIINPITGKPATEEEKQKIQDLVKRVVEEGPGDPPPDDSDETSE